MDWLLVLNDCRSHFLYVQECFDGQEWPEGAGMHVLEFMLKCSGEFVNGWYIVCWIPFCVCGSDRRLMQTDISNVVKPFRIAKQWAVRVTTEFFNQGDAEQDTVSTIQHLQYNTFNTTPSAIRCVCNSRGGMLCHRRNLLACGFTGASFDNDVRPIQESGRESDWIHPLRNTVYLRGISPNFPFFVRDCREHEEQ